jgi:hypothetical protein
MAFDIYELYSSRQVNIGFEKQTATLQFVGYGTDDDTIARQGFIDTVPLLFFGLEFQDMDINPVGGLFWSCTAKYDSVITKDLPGLTGTPSANPDPGNTPPNPTDALGPEYSFDISSVTEHITQSKRTISRTKRGLGIAPDNKRAIGITADGEVQGCDRQSPHLEWSVQRIFGFITLEYIQLLNTLVNKTNKFEFYGFPVGSVLFMGASLQSKSQQNVSVTFKFAVQKNEVGINICDNPDLTVPSKRGWDYLWIAYKNVANANQLTQVPDAAYVEQIYDEVDFALIGIGA